MFHRHFLLFAALLVPSASADAATVLGSDWMDFREARVRLLVTKPETGATHLAGGLQITLAPGYKTYWRNVGDSGVPPHFDFSRSRSIGTPDIAFPFPEIFDDGAGGKAFGYKMNVVLPLTAPVTGVAPVMVLKLDFAVCGTMCIPLSGEFTLDTATASVAGPDAAEALARARAAVPRPAVAGESAVRVERLADEPARFAVTLPWTSTVEGFVAFPEAARFAEVLSSNPVPEGIRIVVALDKPVAGTSHGLLRLTYGARENALEQAIDLDAAKPSP